MPTYIYTAEDGESIQKVMPMSGRRPKKICRGGKVFHRDIPAEWSGRKDSDPWPMWSDALGVHTTQIPDFVKSHAEAGIQVEFNKHDGRCKVESNQHRNQLMEHAQLHDGDGGYGQRMSV